MYANFDAAKQKFMQQSNEEKQQPFFDECWQPKFVGD